jgi:hypothetical protein
VSGARVRLGDWTCPSGNNVEAFYRPLGAGLATLEMEWDEPPPLLASDEVYYAGVIRPELLRRVREYTEQTGCTVVISA